jgi:hypothetical protein
MRNWMIIGFAVAGLLFGTIEAPKFAISKALAQHSHDLESVVNHSGPVDRNGCHRDGSGGYHCH